MVKESPYLNLFRIITLCKLIYACNSSTWWQVMESTTTIRPTLNNNTIIKNSTQILSKTDDVATVRCKKMYGDYCIECNNNICLKCNSSNLTLTNQPQNTNSKQVSFKYNACLCLSPYVPISQPPSSLSSPMCSLCSEFFPLYHCSPILYPSILGSPTLTPSTVANGSIMQLNGFNGPVVGPTRDAATLSEMMSMDSQNYFTWRGNWGFASLGQGVNGTTLVEMVIKNFGIFFSGGQQEILGITYQAKEVEGQVQIIATIKNLYRNYYQYYKDKGYDIGKYFWIQLRKRKDAQGIFLNGTGNPLPKQYKTQLRLGSAYGYYVQAYDYMHYMNGTQVARIKMQTPSIFLSQTNSTTAYTNQTITTNSSNSSIPSNSSNSSNSNSTPTPSSPPPSSSPSAQSAQSPMTPYSVSHSFTPLQTSIKQSIQFSLIFFTTFGLLGTGATNWLLLVLAYTDIFGNLGYFGLDYGVNEGETNGTARRLFGEALPTVQVNVSTLNISQTVLDIAKSTLTMNPLVLLPISFPNPTPLFSTPSPILPIAICLSLLALYLTLIYISRYTRSKTNHTHSHIFHTLSSSSFPYRVVYLTIRGLYPILAYLFIGFARGVIQGLMAGEGELTKNIQRDGSEANWWHWAEISAYACIGLAVIGGPIGGLMFFKKMDVENFYVYGRMFGNIVSEEKDKKQEKEDDVKKDDLREQISGNSCQQQSDDESDSSNSKNDQKQQQDQQSSHNIKQRKQKPKKAKNSNPQKRQLIEPQKTGLQILQPISQQLKVPNPYSQPSQQKKFTPSLKPLLLHILQYIHILSFLIVCSLLPSSSNPLLVPLLLLSFQSIALTFTFYCSFTVSLSKSYSVVKVVQYGLNLVYLLCSMLWADVGFFGWIGYYVYWGVGAWAIVGIGYQGLSALYWEKRGVGVRGFFWNKIVVVGNGNDGDKKDEQIQQSGVNLKKDSQEQAENKRQLVKPESLIKKTNNIVEKVNIDSKKTLIKAKNLQKPKSIKAAATKAKIAKK